MSAVIKINGVGKRYHIGANTGGYKTFREQIENSVRGIFSRGTAVGSSFWALKNVSFDVNQGDVLALIGSNGAGKSTLLKVLTRITEPTEGSAWLKGRVAALLEVGTGFHAELTGRENIFLNGAILGMRQTEIQRKLDQIVDFASIEKFLDTAVKHYSSGMYMRLAFSIAAHLEPEILLVDEVLAVGDANFQQKCIGKMKESVNDGRTVIFVSHNLGAVQALCNRAVLLRGGNVINVGKPDEIVREYLKYEKTHAPDTDLSNIVRGKGLAPLIRQINILDSEGHPTHIVLLGDKLQFEFHIESLESEILENLILNFSITNEYGLNACTFNSMAQSTKSLGSASRLVVICEWAQCNLVPGEYSLTISASASGKKDVLKNVLRFSVAHSDFYKTGQARFDNNSVFVPIGTWWQR